VAQRSAAEQEQEQLRDPSLLVGSRAVSLVAAGWLAPEGRKAVRVVTMAEAVAVLPAAWEVSARPAVTPGLAAVAEVEEQTGQEAVVLPGAVALVVAAAAARSAREASAAKAGFSLVWRFGGEGGVL
jgi:hypothetical protein